MRTLTSLIRLAAPFIGLGMSICTIGLMLADAETRASLSHDWPDVLWVTAPYLAVGILGFLVRSNLIAAVFALVAAVVVAGMGVCLVYPYLLGAHSAEQGMALGQLPIMQC